MAEDKIRLLQFFICESFRAEKQDGYSVQGARSNIYLPSFPSSLAQLNVVTCWRKDHQFHKEVIEYTTDYGVTVKSAHMDIEPSRDNIIFRWHTHRFPAKLIIEKPTTLWIKVILDWQVQLESYLLIEKVSSVVQK